MNIYFACSITGGRQDELAYQAIVEALLADGHTVPTAHLSQSDVMALEAVVDPVDVYSRDIDWINAAELLIAEVSTPSHGVGYEIGYSLSIGKPVLCLHHQEARLSKMLSGNTHPNLRLLAYSSPAEAVAALRAHLAERQSPTLPVTTM